MIFEQPLLNNFNFLSHTLIILFSLFLPFSLYCYCPIRREEKGCPKKLYKIICQNIIPQEKIDNLKRSLESLPTKAEEE